MTKQTDDQKAELAALVRAFIDKGQLTTSRAAQLLGIPKRTLDNILIGRGFPYPILLALAIQAFNSTPDR